MLSRYARKPSLPPGSRPRRPVAFVLALSALLSGIAAPRVHAQDHELTDQWVRDGGTVEVSPGALNIEEGESLTYRIRLTRPLPVENGNRVGGWWVRVHVAGAVRSDGVYDADGDGENDIRWVPSVGWEFNPSDWPPGRDESRWREITVYGLSALDQPVSFKHEVSDHDAYCPQGLHPDGLPVVTVNVIPDQPPEPLPALSIRNAARVIEDSDASFEVRLSKSSQRVVTVSYETESGTAVEGSDFDRASGTLTFDPGSTKQTIEVQTRDDELDEADEKFTVKLSSPNWATLDDETGTGTGTIGDNDAPPKLSIGDAVVGEGGAAQFAVTLDTASGQEVTVRVQTRNGTAQAGSDYDAVDVTLTFDVGATRQTFDVQTTLDAVYEADETFTVRLRSPNGATLDGGTGDGTITDDDPKPSLSIEDVTVNEGERARFEVTLSGERALTVTVRYETQDDTAVAASDYDAREGTLTFSPGDNSEIVEVRTREDTAKEPVETFTVVLSDPKEATVDRATGTGTITDDDEGALPSLRIEDVTVPEEGLAEFVVTLSVESDEDVTVEYETQDGTADAGSDYTAIDDGTLTITSGNLQATIPVETLPDDDYEGAEAFTVRLSNPDGATLDRSTATGTIDDDDDPPLVSIGNATVPEGETAEFEVMLDALSNLPVKVRYATKGGTAVEGTDYTRRSGTLTFQPGNDTLTIEVHTREDSADEPDETFTVELSDQEDARLGNAIGTGTITDDDEGGLPEVSIGDAPPVTEGSSVEAEFTVRLTVAVTEEVTVEYRTVDGTAVADRDYTTTAGTLRFAANDMEKTISVPVADDTTAERTEYFTVELSDPRGATLGRRSGTGTINDNDTGRVPALAIEDAPAVTEGGTALFLVRLSAASSQVVTVVYRTDDGTARAGSDYTLTQGSLRFTAGTIEQTIAVPTLNDTAEERTETFTVELSEPNGATLEQGTGTATINDDDSDDDDGDGGGTDSIPTLTIRDSETVTEGDPAEFVVRLSAESEQAVTVAFATADGTAKAGSDYTSTTGTLRFEPGDTAETITVPTLEDDQAEETEAFTVKLSGASGATLEDATGTGTIADEDGTRGSLPTLSIADALPVAEGGTAEFVVTLSPASEQVVTMSHRTLDGTAVAGSDYTATNGTLRFEPGDTKRTIRVPVLDDEAPEETEGFTVELSDPSGARLEDAAGTGTITDHDETPTLLIDDAPPVGEGETAEFVVTLSPASEQVVTVSHRTLDGTAVAGSDYTSTAGTVRFEPGETTQTITVAVLDDETSEADEVFTVELSGPSGARLEDATGTGTITDDDEPPTLLIDDAPPVGEGETAEFAVRLSAASGQVVTVSYRTVDGTAVAGSDYTSTSGTVRFEPGETTQTIPVAVLDDATSEAEEVFAVKLSEPSQATLEDDSGTGTIIDDDEPPEIVIDDAPPVSEGGTAEFVVRLSAVSGRVVTVSYRTVDGTAAAGSDYTSTAGTLEFDPGATTRTLGVAALMDELVEGAEQFTVELSDPVGATIADGTGAGTITDDAERRIDLVNRTVLPEIGRALAFTPVRCRIDQALSDVARGRAEEPVGHLSLSHLAASGGWATAGTEPLTLERALGDSSFLMPSEGGKGGPGRFAAWGCGDYRNLAGGGEDGAVAWDGEVFSVQLGADVRLGSNVLAGLSVSRSRGSFDYYAGAGNREALGAYNLRLTGVHPYLSWSVLPDLDVWGTVGHAWGELRVVDDLVGGPLTSAATLNSAAVGVSGRLLARGTTALKLKGEGALARLDVAGAGAAFGALAVDMRRLRLSTEASHQHVFSSGGSLTPWGELGLRHDGGDGETGAGLEVGGGLRYQSPEAAWTTEGYGRWLAVHEGALREWGFGALIRFDPGASGRGPSVSLAPAWGETASGVRRLWERGATDPILRDAPGRRVDAQFAYGFAALRGRGVLTPYGTVSLAEEYGRGYRLGGRLAVGRSAIVSLEAERRERAAAAAVHAIMLRGALRF